jgi:hypothetical protein
MTESPTKSHVEEPMQEHAAVASIAQRGSAAQLSAAQLMIVRILLALGMTRGRCVRA